MKRFPVAVGLVAGVGLLGVQILEACGAKFLVSSRAARYQRLQAAENPASILLYWPADASDPVSEYEATADYEAFLAAVEKAGHSLQVTTDLEAFRAAAGTGAFDIFLMDLADARRLRAEIELLSPDTAILPVMEFATRPSLSQAKKEFGQVLSTPTTARRLLATIADSHSN